MMTEAQVVHVSLVLDRTGSMASIQSDAIGGYNAYVDELKKSADDVRFTLTMFDSQSVDLVHEGVEMSQVPHLTEETYQPRAMTPLYDAIMTAVRSLESKVGPDDSVILAVLTDGLENASRRYTLSDVKECITAKQNEGWLFAYLGADQDAWVVGESIGVAPASRVSVDKMSMRANLSQLGRASRRYTEEAKRDPGHPRPFAQYWEESKEEEEDAEE